MTKESLHVKSRLTPGVEWQMLSGVFVANQRAQEMVSTGLAKYLMLSN